jgi:galactokinase
MSNKVFEASAPGRLDVMGGIADYSGSLVLQMPVKQKTEVKLSLRDDYKCHVESITSTGEHLKAIVDFRTYLFNNKVDYAFAQKTFKNAGDSWLAYVLGCALVLTKEKGIAFTGADFFIQSNVPLGKGVSSSASLEVATMKALAKAFNISFSGTELPILAQRVENLIVGAPCGLMDQLASYFGVEQKLLPIICQPDKIESVVEIPNELFFFGIDSGIRHSVGGSSYSDVRCAAFMGYTIIAKKSGATDTDLNFAVQNNDLSNLPYQGYLCNVSPQEFEEQFKKDLPEKILGKEFVKLYGRTIDRVTAINENSTYSVLDCSAHAVYENFRVNNFKALLAELNHEVSNKTVPEQLGKLMFQAHESYSKCGLGSQRTDEIVEWAHQHFANEVYGAKITGGGSGGTVCVLVKGEIGKRAVRDYHQTLCKKYQTDLILFEP